MNRTTALIVSITLSFTCSELMFGQVNDAFNQSRKSVGGGNASAFNGTRKTNFNDYRQKLNAEYVSMTRGKWKDFNSFRGLTSPDNDVKPINPISFSDDELDINDNKIEYGELFRPIKNNETPNPVAPIQETPEQNPQALSFSYLGTSLNVRASKSDRIHLTGIDENSVANALEQLCDSRYNNLVVDCIKLRAELHLCDWAYLMLLKSIGENLCGKDTNEATLVTAFLYSQSGYKIRIGECGGKLDILYASRHDVYGTTYFQIDGVKFFSMNQMTGTIKINPAKFPNEQPLSLWVASTPKINYAASNGRELESERYPDMRVTVNVNKNLLQFYDSYPTSEVGGNFMTRWAMYANTPFSEDVKTVLYGQLKGQIAGYSQYEALQKLLNWVQTAFVYEYDDKVWGHDRAFFPDETLYYPYCDCEDRSILLTRIVRDLLGLRCALVYYPGHLATAIAVGENVKGDYMRIDGIKYLICDPTYIGAPVGKTMPDMDNKAAKVIVL